MSEAFNAKQGLVILSVQVYGPSGDTLTRLALDTGALSTVIDGRILASIGYDLTSTPDKVRIVTASDVITVPRLLVDRIVALGQERTYMPIIGHTLPATTGVDGVLGLDFFRRQRLTLNFRRSRISLA
jgi:hypothetical protein